MLPFELSATDLILAIAVIVLLILYITKSSAKPPTEEKPSVEEGASSKKLAATDASLKKREKTVVNATPKNSPKCPHGFGYLKKLDKNVPIPDECLSCPRMMECLGSNE